jgi:hypothetical protein
MHLQHAATLQAMELSFSENDFKIIENNNWRVSLQNYLAWTGLDNTGKNTREMVLQLWQKHQNASLPPAHASN